MSKNSILPESTMVEVISIKGEKVFKKEMTLKEFRNMNKKKGWRYQVYQIGRSAYPNVIILK